MTTTDVDVIVEDATDQRSSRVAIGAEAAATAPGRWSHASRSPTVGEPEPKTCHEAGRINRAAARSRMRCARSRPAWPSSSGWCRSIPRTPEPGTPWVTCTSQPGEYEEALQAYQEAIENDPTKALFHHHIGLVYACEGRIDEAIDAFQSVIQMDPDHALAHAALGGYYRKKGLEELAQKHIGIAMKSIFDSENEYNRACLAAICGNTEQALELLRIALNSKQTYVDWILRDPDLDFIRQDPRFKQLISDFAR